MRGSELSCGNTCAKRKVTFGCSAAVVPLKVTRFNIYDFSLYWLFILFPSLLSHFTYIVTVTLLITQ